MPDATLEFIARQLERVLAEQREIREQLAVLPGIRDEIGLLRGEFQLLREQVRVQGSTLNRLGDTISFNVLDRLRKLEGTE